MAGIFIHNADGKLVIGLGGEHSITSAPVLAHADRLPEGRRLTILQFDAHGDLRLEYEGSAYSHAAVMAQCIDHADLVQVGIRAITSEERALIREREGNVTTIFADEMWEAIDIDPGIVAVPLDWAEEHNLAETQVFPWDQTKGIYVVNAFHSVHCLVRPPPLAPSPRAPSLTSAENHPPRRVRCAPRPAALARGGARHALHRPHA